MSVSVRRGASNALLALIIKNRKNQADLLSFDQLCDNLFNDFLATCGDYNTQVCRAVIPAEDCLHCVAWRQGLLPQLQIHMQLMHCGPSSTLQRSTCSYCTAGRAAPCRDPHAATALLAKQHLAEIHVQLLHCWPSTTLQRSPGHHLSKLH